MKRPWPRAGSRVTEKKISEKFPPREDTISSLRWITYANRKSSALSNSVSPITIFSPRNREPARAPSPPGNGSSIRWTAPSIMRTGSLVIVFLSRWRRQAKWLWASCTIPAWTSFLPPRKARGRRSIQSRSRSPRFPISRKASWLPGSPPKSSVPLTII